MDSYAAEIAALPNDIRERIDVYAAELLARIDMPGYTTVAETLGGEVHHIIFGGVEGDEGGRVYPVNKAEWLELRDERFEALLTDHCEDRLTAGHYEDPVQGMKAAVCATIADIVADRVVEMNGGYNTPLPTSTVPS